MLLGQHIVMTACSYDAKLLGRYVVPGCAVSACRIHTSAGGIPASVGRRAEYAVSCYTIMLFMPKWLRLRPRINRMLIAIGMSAGTAVMPIRRALEVI